MIGKNGNATNSSLLLCSASLIIQWLDSSISIVSKYIFHKPLTRVFSCIRWHTTQQPSPSQQTTNQWPRHSNESCCSELCVLFPINNGKHRHTQNRVSELFSNHCETNRLLLNWWATFQILCCVTVAQQIILVWTWVWDRVWQLYRNSWGTF